MNFIPVKLFGTGACRNLMASFIEDFQKMSFSTWPSSMEIFSEGTVCMKDFQRNYLGHNFANFHDISKQGPGSKNSGFWNFHKPKIWTI